MLSGEEEVKGKGAEEAQQSDADNVHHSGELRRDNREREIKQRQTEATTHMSPDVQSLSSPHAAAASI